jgi:hypothetical protein
VAYSWWLVAMVMPALALLGGVVYLIEGHLAVGRVAGTALARSW